MKSALDYQNLTIFSPAEAQTLIPLASSTVKAGFPSPAEDHVEKKLDLNDLLVKHPAATFFVRVEGRSMEGAHIFEGDILVVDRSLQPSDGKIVIAVIDGEFTVKRFRKKGSSFSLCAENTSFPSLEIAETSEVEIWGIATYIIHKAK